MKQPAACLPLLAFLLPLVFASLIAKPAAGSLVSRRTRSSSSSTASQSSGSRKSSLSSSGKSAEPLSSILPPVLLRIVIDYYYDADDDAHSAIVSVLDMLFKDAPDIAVDSARAYLISASTDIVGIDHLLGTTAQLFDLRRSIFRQFASSQDGRHLLLNYAMASSKHGFSGRTITGLYTQGDELEDAGPIPIKFGGKHSDKSILSRDGRTVCSYSRHDRATSVHRIAEQDGSGKETGSLKCSLHGSAVAVSGRGNRIAAKVGKRVIVYDVDPDVRALTSVASSRLSVCALNEDGSEVASVIRNTSVHIVAVDATREPVAIPVPNPAERISRLMYTERGQLYAFYADGRISLVDPRTSRFVPLQGSQAKEAIKVAISPNADYVAVLEKVGNDSRWSLRALMRQIFGRTPSQDGGEAEQRQPFTHRMTVWHRLSKSDYEVALGIQ